MSQPSPEAREAEMRSYADQLARELEEFSVQRNMEGDRERWGMNAAKERVRKLVGLLVDLHGRSVDQEVGENGIIHFRAGDPKKSYQEDGRYHSLVYAEKGERGEDPLVVAFLNASDGGSMLMQRQGQDKDLVAQGGEGGPHDPTLRGAAEDVTFAQDTQWLAKGYHHPDEGILANRYREIRMVARMTRLLLGSKESK